MKAPVVIREAAFLDEKNRPICQGEVELHPDSGVGNLVPVIAPIPAEDHVDEQATSLLLSSGEVLPIRNVSRCAISEVHYEFDLATGEGHLDAPPGG